MRTRIVSLLLASSLVALAVWLVHAPSAAQADDVPEKYRDTVQKGLEHLVKNQHKDAPWGGDDGKRPVARTGLVGLALLMEKKEDRRGGTTRVVSNLKNSANIRCCA